MPVPLYMDHHVPRAVTEGLRLRGVDVLTAHEDGASELDDASLLDRAHSLRRALFTRDRHLLVEASRRQHDDTEFGGVIYAHQLRVSIGQCVDDLELLAQTADWGVLLNQVVFLPL